MKEIHWHIYHCKQCLELFGVNRRPCNDLVLEEPIRTETIHKDCPLPDGEKK